MQDLVFFGYYQHAGSRSWVLEKGLTALGYRVHHCCTDRPGFLAKIRHLYQQYRLLPPQHVLIVMFPGQYLVPFAWILSRLRRVPLIFDSFISLYDTKVCDRHLISPWSISANYLWFIDFLSCHLCDCILLDTPEHAEYFARTFFCSARRFLSLHIGCRSDIFLYTPYVSHLPAEPFRLLFHGTFIPLHGIETILRAISILEDHQCVLDVNMIGGGQTLRAMKSLADTLHLRSITWRGMLPQQTLVQYLQRCHAAFGIFGVTQKTTRVISHKVYEILAVGRPLLTGDTPSARRFLSHGHSALLSPCGDHQALADNILTLISNPQYAMSIAKAGHQLSLSQCDPATTVAPLHQWLLNHSSCHRKKSSSQA